MPDHRDEEAVAKRQIHIIYGKDCAIHLGCILWRCRILQQLFLWYGSRPMHEAPLRRIFRWAKDASQSNNSSSGNIPHFHSAKCI